MGLGQNSGMWHVNMAIEHEQGNRHTALSTRPDQAQKHAASENTEQNRAKPAQGSNRANSITTEQDQTTEVSRCEIKGWMYGVGQ